MHIGFIVGAFICLIGGLVAFDRFKKTLSHSTNLESKDVIEAALWAAAFLGAIVAALVMLMGGL